MSAQQFRKKPVEIEAIQYRADITPPGVNEVWLRPDEFTWPESGVSIEGKRADFPERAAELLDLVAAREAELAQEATE